MSQEIWFKNDIKNVLMGVDLANSNLAVRLSDHESQVFREGFQAALAAAAVSFGLRPLEVRCSTFLGLPQTNERVHAKEEPSVLIALAVPN